MSFGDGHVVNSNRNFAQFDGKTGGTDKVWVNDQIRLDVNGVHIRDDVKGVRVRGLHRR